MDPRRRWARCRARPLARGRRGRLPEGRGTCAGPAGTAQPDYWTPTTARTSAPTTSPSTEDYLGSRSASRSGTRCTGAMRKDGKHWHPLRPQSAGPHSCSIAAHSVPRPNMSAYRARSGTISGAAGVRSGQRRLRGDQGYRGERTSRKPMKSRRTPGSAPPRTVVRTFWAVSANPPPRMTQRASVARSALSSASVYG